MAEPTRALTRQLLEWIAEKPRTYAEVLDAWRTTCPRLSIWEDACIDGLIDRDPAGDGFVALSLKGRALAESWVRGPRPGRGEVDAHSRRGECDASP
jgi:hypothetical protein